MDEIVRLNGSVIYENPNSTFIVDKDGRLSSISWFNLIGRVVEWIRDLASGSQRSARASEIVTATVKKIADYLEENPLNSYFHCYREDKKDRMVFGNLFFKFSVDFDFPLNYLAKKLMESCLVKKPEILAAAKKIENFTKGIEVKLNKQEADDFIRNMHVFQNS